MLNNHEQLDFIDSMTQYIKHKNTHPYVEFKNPSIWGVIQYNPETDKFVIHGRTRANQVTYFGATPLIRNYSYSGSGLPFPHYLSAYENTSNIGKVEVIDGLFKIEVQHPSQYYVAQGRKLLKPHIHLILDDSPNIISLVLADYLPFRSLTNLPHKPNRSIGR